MDMSGHQRQFGRRGGGAIDARSPVHDRAMPQPTGPAPVEYFWQPINPHWLLAGISFAVIEALVEMLFYGYDIPGLLSWAGAMPQLLYALCGLLGIMWLFVLIRGNPYAVRLDERGIDIPTMYDRIIPWDRIVAIRTQSVLGLFRIVHITVGQRFELGYYRHMQLPGGERNPRGDTISVKKAGIPVWMTNGKLKQVLAETERFWTAYGPDHGDGLERDLQA